MKRFALVTAALGLAGLTAACNPSPNTVISIGGTTFGGPSGRQEPSRLG